MGMRFEDLEAWQQARELVRNIYRISRDTDLGKDFSLRDQITRAAVSAMTNIAEGFERTGTTEKRHFYNMARASCGEVRSLLYILSDISLISPEHRITLQDLSIRTGKLLSGLIRSTENRP